MLFYLKFFHEIILFSIGNGTLVPPGPQFYILSFYLIVLNMYHMEKTCYADMGKIDCFDLLEIILLPYLLFTLIFGATP